MIEIAPLTDVPDIIPTLVELFRSHWPEYYAARTPDDVAQDFYAELNRANIPLRLVAFIDGVLVGTIALREHALHSFPEYQPGLGGLFVVEPYRGQGIGTELVRAGLQLAMKLGYSKVFTSTAAAKGILQRLGWKLERNIMHDNESLGLYCFEFDF